MDHNTRISLLDLSPDNLKLKVWSGSVILEVAILDRLRGNDWEEQRKQLSYEPVSLLTPTAQYLVAGGGSYRLKVNEKGSSQLSLLKGIAFVNGSRIDSGMTASAADGVLKKITGDSFDVWAYRRSRLLEVRNFRRYFGPHGGMWCFVESTGEYTFVPAAVEYRSPYGGRYSTTYGEPGVFQRR